MLINLFTILCSQSVTTINQNHPFDYHIVDVKDNSIDKLKNNETPVENMFNKVLILLLFTFIVLFVVEISPIPTLIYCKLYA